MTKRSFLSSEGLKPAETQSVEFFVCSAILCWCYKLQLLLTGWFQWWWCFELMIMELLRNQWLSFLSDSGRPNWSRECGWWWPYTDPGSAVDHHPSVPDWTHQTGWGNESTLSTAAHRSLICRSQYKLFFATYWHKLWLQFGQQVNFIP